jgi:peptidyl-prolyl cis-trans isomerase C
MAPPFPRPIVFLILVVVLLSGCAKPKPDEIVAHVDDMEIHVGDILKDINREKDQYDPKSLKSSRLFLKIKQRVLDEIIDRKLLTREANRHGILVGEDELQNEIRKFKSHYTELTFQKMLQERQLSNEEWEELRRENYLVTKFLKEYFSNHEIGDEEIEKYYREHPEEFNIPESVRARQIVTDTKEKAEAILRRLRNGENFAKLARDLSLSPDRKQGGDLGFIQRGTFPREFEVSFTMNPGEISPIIPSLYGFHIFKVLEKAPAKTLSLEEVRDKIVSELTQAAHQQAAQDLLKNLRQNSHIQIDEKLLKRISL